MLLAYGKKIEVCDEIGCSTPKQLMDCEQPEAYVTSSFFSELIAMNLVLNSKFQEPEITCDKGKRQKPDNSGMFVSGLVVGGLGFGGIGC